MDDAHDRTEFRISGFPKCFIKAFAIETGILRYLTHAARAGDETERVTDKIGVAEFERSRYVGNLTLFVSR